MRKNISLLVAVATLILAIGSAERTEAKATATVFYSEHFDTGIPAGWTTGIFAGPNASWKWFAQGQVTTSMYALPAINTSTGFMIYDADSINLLAPANTAKGWLKSAVISCTGHPYVAVKFNQAFRRFNDSCFLDVSTNNFATYTRYSIDENNGLPANGYLPSNPYNTEVNISSVAANNANVQIRFSYITTTAGYSWQIDDVELVEPDPTDVSLHNSFLYTYNGLHVNTIPLQLADTIGIVGRLYNMGYNAQTNVTVNAKIYRNASLVYNQNSVISNLAVNAMGELATFPSYQPSSTGNYIIALSTSVPGNVNTQVTDTVYMTVTDTIWSQNMNNAITNSSFYVHKPSPDEKSYYCATRFSIGNGASDTVSAMSVAFKHTTSPGTNIVLQLYKWNVITSLWDPVGVTYPHNITASEISTVSNVVNAYFPIDTSSGQVIMDSGDYAAVVTTVYAPANAEVTVLCSGTQTPYSGPVGLMDTSANDGGFYFGNNLVYSLDSIPMIHLHFGPYNYVPVGSSVWPGDVNDDLTADNNDALDILLGWGNTGTTRPSANISWTGQPCADWGTFIVPTVDMKNADCNGDGAVGYSDTVAIWNNYGQIHLKGEHSAQPKATGLPDLYFDLAAVNFIAGTTVHIPIKLGTAAQPMNNIMGIAAQIKTNGVLLTSSPGVSINTSWMGTAANLLNFTKGVNSNETDWAIGRTNHTNVSGDGTIATLDVNLPTNVSGPMTFYFDNVRIIDNGGNVITGYNVIDDTATVIPASTHNVMTPVQQVAVIPNPSSSQSVVQMYLNVPARIHVTVTDVTGKTLYEMVKDGKQGLQHFELPAAELAPGVYTVKLSSESWEGTETLKWVRN